MADETQIHATAVALEGLGILLRGPSGSGKSDLGIRLIDRGAVLIADDRVDLRRRGDNILASPPNALAGKIEVRGLGVVETVHRGDIPIVAAFNLVAGAEIERLPEPETVDFLGVAVPRFYIAAFESSATAKVRLAAGAVSGSIMRLPTDG